MRRSKARARLFAAWAFTTSLTSLNFAAAADDKATGNPLAQWSVREGYSLSIAAKGFDLPTDLELVPSPGAAPTAPRFFIAELRGKIRIIANNGTVSDFTSVTTFVPKAEWPDFSGEAGLGSICLDPTHGYIFATYAYRDLEGVLRNGIARFSASPGTLEGPATNPQNFSAWLAKTPSSFSHQIGSCVVSGDSLFVSIGDGGNPAKARDLDVPLGKIVRLTLDGAPYPDNAFFSAGGARATVYAWGFRNTFGLSLVGTRLFSAENGVDMDRFLEIQGGRDHGWDGTDPSIAMNSYAIFSPTIGPAHVTHAGPETTVLEHADTDRFLIAASNCRQAPGVVTVNLDMKNNFVVDTPRYLVHFDGDAQGQGVTGIAMAGDGLYFTPITPVGDTGVVLVTRFDPKNAHTSVIGKKAGDPIAARGCLGCHSLNGMGAHVGPPLDNNSLMTRTETRVLDPSYAVLVAKLDAVMDESVVNGRAARHEVLDAERDSKARTWIINRIMNPKFDTPDAAMPTLGIPRKEAEIIADRLIGPPERSRVLDALHSGRFMGGFGGGVMFSLGIGGIAFALARRRQSRRAAPGPASP